MVGFATKTPQTRLNFQTDTLLCCPWTDTAHFDLLETHCKRLHIEPGDEKCQPSANRDAAADCNSIKDPFAKLNSAGTISRNELNAASRDALPL